MKMQHSLDCTTHKKLDDIIKELATFNKNMEDFNTNFENAADILLEFKKEAWKMVKKVPGIVESNDKNDTKTPNKTGGWGDGGFG